ncbi:hypothetical protein SBA1_120085 [Candidatus Sulfotelmatobacter kueseliae]|uniref:Uncharacterized protein n=1 Tax=Candidatus Sulfotelmatobacter kueseliae TaxID=2042962 RepID=A0A2U3K243_9BACT|nr:hypothetical protein SBA1_120085 [Candidatus Sulfotelmatobacter kueseliae]
MLGAGTLAGRFAVRANVGGCIIFIFFAVAPFRMPCFLEPDVGLMFRIDLLTDVSMITGTCDFDHRSGTKSSVSKYSTKIALWITSALRCRARNCSRT